MVEQNTEAKLKFLLKKEKIQLWKPPYTDHQKEAGTQHLEALSQRFSLLLGLPVETVSVAMEMVRAQAVMRGKNNQTFRDTSEATLEILLPRGPQEVKKKNFLQTKLDITGQELVDRIMEQFGVKNIRLIVSGRTLCVDQRLDQQEVRNHSKLMVLMKSEEEEEMKNLQSVRRTQRGFEILSERDGSESDSTPILEIADQRGNLLKIPEQEKKSLILAMGLHVKGRTLMKKKKYDQALLHLLQADTHFSACGSTLLSSVDNPAVLQLDVVWCFWALESLSCLEDGRSRLQRAELCFHQSYGAQRERLLSIKGTSGREDVLYLRLFVLQSLLSYLDGNDAEAALLLTQAEALRHRLVPDSEKMALLMNLGFSEREARLALRDTGDVEEAAAHIHTHRQEREDVRLRERQMRKRKMKAISSLVELGFSRKDSFRAVEEAEGDADRAYSILCDSASVQNVNNNNCEISAEKIQQLLYLGFEPSSCEFALRLTDGDIHQATEILLEHQDLHQPSSSSSSSSLLGSPQGPSTSSSDDKEVVNEALEDLPHYEDDYLDVTLEEELQLINTIRAYLGQQAPPTQ
ncbi:NEDD8 ultimate buster 1 isoform X2 [Gouania willdenowi]|uniref:UBA domain-containing protein n=1 Tax=Gouania willdenowi TaxID=441366 RepID=A0A8C5DTK8_GOUWI|nr:NEDD8 ultimate buster 1 isoform X2 [Gouania willdenowi]